MVNIIFVNRYFNYNNVTLTLYQKPLFRPIQSNGLSVATDNF